MIKHYEKFRLVDESKRNEFYAEVNWSDDDEVTDCKLIRFTFPGGKETIIRREHLNSILFLIGKEEDQRKMIPQTLTNQRYVRTVLGITATKDIRKGEMINVPVKIPIPSVEEEIIGEIKGQFKKDDLI